MSTRTPLPTVNERDTENVSNLGVLVDLPGRLPSRCRREHDRSLCRVGGPAGSALEIVGRPSAPRGSPGGPFPGEGGPPAAGEGREGPPCPATGAREAAVRRGVAACVGPLPRLVLILGKRLNRTGSSCEAVRWETCR